MSKQTAPTVFSDSDRRLIPLSQAAQRMGISRDQALRLVTKGIIDGEWTGTRWFVKERSLPTSAVAVGDDLPPAA